MSVLTLASLRYLRRHPWQLGLAILGIALGVAVVVAIDLANGSARRAFELSAEGLSGRATHRITGGVGGLADSVYTDLRLGLGLRAAAPVVEGHVSLPDHPGRTFLLLGIDPLAEAAVRDLLRAAITPGGPALAPLLSRADGLLLAAPVAAELGLEPGRELLVASAGVRHRLVVTAVSTPADALEARALDSVLVVDIATAQEVLDRVGRLSHIDLRLPPGPEEQALLARIADLLPADASLEAIGARANVMVQMTRAFNLNLTMLSLLALVVGVFLIYNTMTFSVVQRRSLIATWRALGVSRGEIFRLILLEALLLGAVGTLLGLAIGIGLAQGLLGLVTRTINDLYFVVSVRELSLAPALLAKGTLLGIAASVLAAWWPAREAARVTPRAAASRSGMESRLAAGVPRAAWLGAGVLLASGAALLLPTRSLMLGFATLFGVILGFTLLAPAVTLLLSRVLRDCLAGAGSVLGALSARALSASLSRTGVAVAALMVAIAATVGVRVMVDSFRASVVDWLSRTLQADVYVSAPSPGPSLSTAVLDPDWMARVAALPGVAAVSTARPVEVGTPAGPVRLNVFQLVPQSYRGFQLLEGDSDRVWADFESGGVLLSEPYAYRSALGAGDRVYLRTPAGERAFPVLAVYRDYGSERGVISMSRRTYERHWNDPGVSALGLYAAPGSDPEDLMRAVRTLAEGEREAVVRSNRGLRDASLEVFDRTFTITRVLQMLATLVAFVGVMSALMALELERAREVAILRAVGLQARQVRGLIGSQTAVLGLMAGVLALPLGLSLAAILVHVINRRSFGWSMTLQVEPVVLGQALLLALVAALLAGVYPAWRMARRPPALALRED